MKVTMKKTLSCVLILMMVISTMVILPLTASAASGVGSGTESDPYVIRTPDDLLYFCGFELENSDQVVYMELANDIDMSGVQGFVSIKMKRDNSLIFEGNNHTIKNLMVTDGYGGSYSFWVGGLFGLLRAGSMIANLKMENVTVDAIESNCCVGGIVGEAYAPFYMENCSVTGSVTAQERDGAIFVGGLVGYLHGSSSTDDVIFSNCINEATVTVETSVQETNIGGILGCLGSVSEYIFFNCINKGDLSMPVSMLSTGCVNMGGILGYAYSIYGYTDIPPQMYMNCANTGDMSIADTYQANAMGGIVGSARTVGDPSSGAELMMVSCFDYSARSFHSVWGVNGAIAGYPSSKDGDRTFAGCYAVNKAGSESPYTILCYEDLGASIEVIFLECGIVETVDTVITLSDGSTITVAEAIASIEQGMFCFEHEYDDFCDDTCNLCGDVREAPHNYDNDCDTTCNDCGDVRTITHTYSNDCDDTCNVCGATRTPSDHVYDSCNDQFCNVCNTKRAGTGHVYDDECDSSCSICGGSRVAPHVYDDECDTNCNLCDQTRTVNNHTYYNDCDVDCNRCGATRTVGGHVYADNCDGDCNICDENRKAPHVYDNSCDAECNNCDAKRTPGAHEYSNDEDLTCNICGATKTVANQNNDSAQANGCGGSLNSTYAVLAIVAILGFALVAKKREEN